MQGDQGDYFDAGETNKLLSEHLI